MKKYFALVGLLVLATSTSNAQELNLDEILSKHYNAMGFDKLQDVKSIIMVGTITTHVVMPIKIYKVRPNKYRMESDVADITGLQVFDGQNGWTTAPWTGNADPQVASGPALIDLKVRADFDGAIYSWKVKGHAVELVGIEKISDSDVYKIKLTRNDGGIEFYFINSKNFLLQRRTRSQIVRGKEVEVVSDFSDYRNIDGIEFSFENENMIGGKIYSTIQFETFDLNKPVDEALFIIPKAK